MAKPINVAFAIVKAFPFYIDEHIYLLLGLYWNFCNLGHTWSFCQTPCWYLLTFYAKYNKDLTGKQFFSENLKPIVTMKK